MQILISHCDPNIGRTSFTNSRLCFHRVNSKLPAVLLQCRIKLRDDCFQRRMRAVDDCKLSLHRRSGNPERWRVNDYRTFACIHEQLDILRHHERQDNARELVEWSSGVGDFHYIRGHRYGRNSIHRVRKLGDF